MTGDEALAVLAKEFGFTAVYVYIPPGAKDDTVRGVAMAMDDNTIIAMAVEMLSGEEES